MSEGADTRQNRSSQERRRDELRYIPATTPVSPFAQGAGTGGARCGGGRLTRSGRVRWGPGFQIMLQWIRAKKGLVPEASEASGGRRELGYASLGADTSWLAYRIEDMKFVRC